MRIKMRYKLRMQRQPPSSSLTIRVNQQQYINVIGIAGMSRWYVMNLTYAVYLLAATLLLLLHFITAIDAVAVTSTTTTATVTSTSTSTAIMPTAMSTSTSTSTSSSAVPAYVNFQYDYQCFGEKMANDEASSISLRQIPIGLQVSDRVTHQLMTRIFAIFLREVLNYRNISIIPITYTNFNESNQHYEIEKLGHTLELIKYHPKLPDMIMINLEVWMPAMGYRLKPTTTYDAGPSITPGRYGWFVPESQIKGRTATNSSSSFNHLDYKIFLHPHTSQYKEYILDDELMVHLRQSKEVVEFISPKCVNRHCATLLAEHHRDTSFIEHQITEFQAYVNVMWLGDQFSQTVSELYELYKNNNNNNKRFVILHWTPSDVIDGDGIRFRQISLPKCEDFLSLQSSFCKYELTPLLKFHSQSLQTDGGGGDTRLLMALRKFILSDLALKELYSDMKSQHEKYTQRREALYDAVACNWLQRNEPTYSRWISKEPRVNLYIGGIFPITQTSRGHANLVRAVRQAVADINANSTILRDYSLDVLENDGQCKADEVMKAFIHYFNVPNILGVLGPACSETVEPIAGISKHTNMAVISYSAEGASFVDRQAYPYFFRTIGSNRQYEMAYISLMQYLGWRRVAALTEDGQKYTEYISHMEGTMKQRNLELLVNKKFLSDVTPAQMNKYLLDLKQRHAKIIIADIHNRNAEIAMCEAYKLKMTAYEGYVWFLPSWLSKQWNTTRYGNDNETCTAEQLQRAFDGHFSIMHKPFGSSDELMQKNITVKQWLMDYYRAVGGSNRTILSNYAGFAYDGVWAYALAADKLLQENRDAVSNLRSDQVVSRFVDLIWQTDFNGLSGRVRFGEGGSRITDLLIVQWRTSHFIQVGEFMPELKMHNGTLIPLGGHLVMNAANRIKWFAGSEPPGDGTFDCSLAWLTSIMGTNCDAAPVVLTVVLCSMALITVSLISFLFWKQRYQKKLKESAKIMKNFGIDLLSPSRSKGNTLDKWEIPKENVFVNRRLGEGAFGMVYGGEAQLKPGAWTAVAVKTLKSGASTEDRLDFLSEAEAMKRFDHKNIVKLLGVCLQSEPIYSIMEFMLYGDLKIYLLARRHLVNDKSSDESDISPKRLTMYAMDVARGLAYLASQKYVHRDVACRNCLVNAERVVKLGDFGMSRPTFDSDYYRFSRKGMLPVRWMAPESLALGLFTPASDVWAFGVVVYEIITFGSFPYQGLTNNQAFEYVKSGNTLQIPTGVKPQLEGLLKACWSQDAKKRPTAAEVVDYISSYPRLLTPCIDFPSAAVEMPETESDELELLPKTRKCSPLKKDITLDILPENENCNGFLKAPLDCVEEMEMPECHPKLDIPKSVNVTNTVPNDTFVATTPDGYSIMSPLLMYQTVSENSDSSQAHLIPKLPIIAPQKPQGVVTPAPLKQQQTPF